ncbi:MAG: tetratricopeptide repeat protein, partial [Longimicrobiales bacterium]
MNAPAAAGRSWPVAVAVVAALALAAAPVRSQIRPLSEDQRSLRDAARLESAGELDRAATVLAAILERHPHNLSALLAYERVLGMQGRMDELLPAVDRVIEHDPTSTISHQMRVRAYSALDSLSALERAAQTWIATTPTIETPYREVARVWRTRGDLVRAVAVLEQGRERIHRDDALALELGDLFAAGGDMAGAVREWNRAIGPDGHGFLLVQRRIQMLPAGVAEIIPQLVEALAASPATVPRRRAAAQLAMDAGLAEPAGRIARGIAAELTGADRRGFLIEVARGADGGGLPHLAYWAYGQLVATDGPDDQMLALRNRLAELALAVGDTVQTAESYRRLEAAFAPDSPQRRQALAVRLQLMARNGDLDAAQRELAAFRAEFPTAPETDAVTAAVANALLDADDVPGAERALADASGPRTGFARGRLFLRRGETARARAELLESAPMLHGSEATEAIALATLLGRLSEGGGALVARAMATAAADDPDGAARLLLEESAGLPQGERAAILDFAAGLA